MSAQHINSWISQRLEEVIGSSGIWVTDGYELQWGSWELNLGRLEELPVLLTFDPSLQLPLMFLRSKYVPKVLFCSQKLHFTYQLF